VLLELLLLEHLQVLLELLLLLEAEEERGGVHRIRRRQAPGAHPASRPFRRGHS
jgi:hypothetical protein